MSGTIPQFGDPFSAAAGDQTQPGFLGQSPAFWQHLAMFGGNLSSAANARTGSGHLAYGTGFAGPFGAAIGETAQQAQQQAGNQANIGRSRAETTGIGLQNRMNALQLPFAEQRAKLQQAMASDPNFMQMLGYGGGDGQGGGYSTPVFNPPPGQSAGGANLESGVHRNESGGSMAPGIVGDGGRAFGPMQVHAAALQDVNQKFGTKYSPQDLVANPTIGKWVGDQYLQMQQQQFGPTGGVAAYNAGPGRVQQALTGQAPLPAATQDYVQRAAGGSPGDSYLQQADVLTARANRVAAAQSAAKFLQMPVAPGMAIDPTALHTQAQQLRETGLKMNSAGPVAGSAEGAKLSEDLRLSPEIKRQETIAETSVKPQIDRYGNAYGPGPDGKPQLLGRGSEVKEVLQPDGSYAYGDVGGIGIGSPSNLKTPPGAPGAAGNEAPQIAKPSNLQTEFLHERGEALGKQFNEIDEAATAAKDSNYLFDNMRRDAKTWEMGKFADVEGEARAWLSAVAHGFGIKPKGLDEKLADFEAFNKSSGQLLRSAVKDTSSRAAVQEYKLIGDSLPQPRTSEQGFGQVADQWQGMNDFRLAKQRFAHGYQDHPEKFNVDFNSRVSPTAFMLNRMAQSPEGQETMKGMLARMQQTPEGRLGAGRMLQGFSYARQNGLFDDLPPQDASASSAPPPGQ